ncbi:MAG: hypothetical protein IJR82_05905 [Bacilli bacterium]|nr:hypothetical protein [Bacilli bacterium]
MSVKLDKDNINIYLQGEIDYATLLQIIFDYFNKIQGLKVELLNKDDFESNFIDNSWKCSFFYIDKELGKTKFNLSKEDIDRIFKLYLACKNLKLINGLEYCINDTIKYVYEENANLNSELNALEKEVVFDLICDSKISYKKLRKIIIDYYEKFQGIKLELIDTDSLREILIKEDNKNAQQQLIVANDECGRMKIDISKEDIEKILKLFLESKNYQLIQFTFDNKIKLRYKPIKVDVSMNLQNFSLGKINSVKKDSSPRKFKILKIERAINKAQQEKKDSAMMAGFCIFGIVASLYFNGQDFNQLIHQNIYTLEGLTQFIHNSGSVATFFYAGAGSFIANYFRNSHKLRKAKKQLEMYSSNNDDFSNSNNPKIRKKRK